MRGMYSPQLPKQPSDKAINQRIFRWEDNNTESSKSLSLDQFLEELTGIGHIDKIIITSNYDDFFKSAKTALIIVTTK